MELLGVTLLGGLLALDATTVGQFMVSRPLAAGVLAGWLVGNPVLGFGVGVLLEMYLIVEFPVGGARFPEGATATVIAVASAVVVPGPGGLAVGTAAGLVWGQLGGISVSGLRRLNGHLVPDPADGPVGPRAVVRAHAAGLALDLLRGTLVTLTGVLAGRAAVVTLAPHWPVGDAGTRGVLLLGGVVSLGILLRSFGGFRRRARVFLAGLLAGVVAAGVAGSLRGFVP